MSANEDEVPEIQNDPGSGDEWTARAVILAPFAILTIASLSFIGLIVAGYIPVNVTIEGTIGAQGAFNTVVRPILLASAAVMVLAFVLALMKEYGTNPVTYLIERVANIAKNYNPPEENQ